MAKDPIEKEFTDLVKRMHNSADLRILKEYVDNKIDICRIKRHDPHIIESNPLLTSVNGEDYAWHELTTDITNALGH